ncbi:hypothetical protein [Nonomuraea bangladeshensis]|uniref:hypothetical protein n=1 Tax=Nonomuraea bangladeshensis TaxID=404385 RepID=UPI003C2BCF1F
MLLGRQRRAVAEREYDSEGRLVREVVTYDAEWTEEDLAYAKAHRRIEHDRCPGCGLPLSETTDPDREGDYEAPPPMRCHACTPMEHRKSEYTESPPGLLFSVHLKDKPAC